MSGNTTPKHLKLQISAYDVLNVLGFTRPAHGSHADYNEQVVQLAKEIRSGFRPSQQQLATLRQIQPSPEAMTHDVDGQIREDWTTAMLLLGGAPQFGSQRTIQAVSEQVIAKGRHICQQFGISLEAAVTGLREASQLVSSSR